MHFEKFNFTQGTEGQTIWNVELKGICETGGVSGTLSRYFGKPLGEDVWGPDFTLSHGYDRLINNNSHNFLKETITFWIIAR